MVTSKNEYPPEALVCRVANNFLRGLIVEITGVRLCCSWNAPDGELLFETVQGSGEYVSLLRYEMCPLTPAAKQFVRYAHP